MPVASQNPATEDYYLTQAALGALVASQVAESAPALDPADLVSSFELARGWAADLVLDHAAAAAGFAVDYYEEFRALAGTRTPLRVPVMDLPAVEVFERNLDRSADQLLLAVDAVVDDLYLAELALQLQAELQGEAQSQVADVGVEQLFTAMRSDREARGWVRVTRTGACSFCRMLAMRGPVFNKESVRFRAHDVVNGRGGVCQCTAEPVFGEFEATAQARSDEALWDQISREGFRGADARYEFRRRIEGRTGGRRSRKTEVVANKSPVQREAVRSGFDALTAADLTHQLSVLERLPDTEYKRQQVARVTERLKALGGSSPA